MMKLFIWEGDGVLTDHTNGMIVAVAPDLQGALDLISATDSVAIGNFPPEKARVIDLTNAKPEAWLCWGGA